MTNSRLSLFTDRLFLVSLLCLLANDQVLKYEFPGFVTGKLSDVAGLFAFPFFWSAIFWRQRKWMYWFTAGIFIFWKTPLSTAWIDWTNLTFGTGFGRVMDFSDLPALAVLPFSYAWLERTARASSGCHSRITWLISIVSLFTFVATSLPRKSILMDLPIGTSYVVELSKQEIINNRIYHMQGTDSLALLSDSLFTVHYPVTNYYVLADVKIVEVTSASTNIEFVKVKGVNYYGPLGPIFLPKKDRQREKLEALTKDDFTKTFESDFLAIIKVNKWSDSHVSFWKTSPGDSLP